MLYFFLLICFYKGNKTIIRKKKKTVGVIAIDPSSSKSGGALLGDRTRFQLNPNDGGVYVRSMAAKDYLGGVSELTYPTMTVMRSKFDFLIIETVGVGQSETSIKDATTCTDSLKPAEEAVQNRRLSHM